MNSRTAASRLAGGEKAEAEPPFARLETSPIPFRHVKDFRQKARHQNLGGHLRKLGIEYAPSDEPDASVEV